MLRLSLEELQEQHQEEGALEIKDYVMMEALSDCMRRLRIEMTKDQIAVATDELEKAHRETGTPFPVNEQGNSIYHMPRRAKAANS